MLRAMPSGSYFDGRFALFRDAYKRNAGWFRRSFESAAGD